ncbi:MAG: radical SAM protein [Myxococcota bacterium]|nr:radical SAM protein [Myxococcota bacterium]
MIPPRPWQPRFCVFEITLACNMNCYHCGSKAGRQRENELDTNEALALIGDLAGLGCRSITLSGGEPLLREDWPELVAAIHRHGMRPELITNGLQTAEQADAIADACFFAVTYSIDGPADVHDSLRNMPGALDRLLQGATALKQRSVRLGAVTQVNQRNFDRIDEIHNLLVDTGFEGWQVQLTLPYGRAKTRAQDLCLSPEALPALEKSLLKLMERSPLFVQAADNIGYFSRAEPQLRAGSQSRRRIWAGCQAGLNVIGITSDGTVRGCLSLPDHLDEGSCRERPVAQIWNDPAGFAYNRRFTVNDLDGFCRDCPFGQLCRAGCTALSVATSGLTGHNAHCLHRLTGANHTEAPE